MSEGSSQIQADSARLVAPVLDNTESDRPVVLFNCWRNYALIGAGWFFVGLGLLGAVLPLLPTTPFLLLAAACFARSSQRFYDWLHANSLFGEYLRRYRNGDGLPLRVKMFALFLLWSSLGFSIFLVLPAHRWYLHLVLAGIGVTVSVHVLRIKTRAAGEK